MKYILCILISVFIVSCNSPEEDTRLQFKLLTDYNINLGLLDDGAAIQLLQISWNQDPSLSENGFIQVVAINKATKDTFNILTKMTISFNESDGEKTFIYKKYDEDILAIAKRQHNAATAVKEELKNINDTSEFTIDKALDNQLKEYSMSIERGQVYLDKTMLHEFNNHYPTTVGSITRQ